MVQAVSAQYQEAVNAETANLIGLPSLAAIDSGGTWFWLHLVNHRSEHSELQADAVSIPTTLSQFSTY